MSKALPSLWTRYWPNVVNGPNDCWLWAATKNDDGYGYIYYGRRKLLAHRVSYRWFKGPMPSWLETDHLCRTRACVNPAHLEAVTGLVNLLRSIAARSIQPTAPADWTPKDGATHCLHGHPWTPENTIIRRWEQYQKRRCKTCQYERVADWRRRQASAS